jgi:hypothetical protein
MKATPQETVELRNLLPVLARLIENGKISIRLGPVADAKDWLDNYQAFEESASESDGLEWVAERPVERGNSC